MKKVVVGVSIFQIRMLIGDQEHQNHDCLGSPYDSLTSYFHESFLSTGCFYVFAKEAKIPVTVYRFLDIILLRHKNLL